MIIRPKNLFFFFYDFIIASNIIGAVLIYMTGANVFLGLKDMCLILVFLIFPFLFKIKKRVINNSLVIFLLFLTPLFVFFIASDAGFLARFTAIRQLIVFWIIFCVAIYYTGTRTFNYEKVLIKIIKIGLFVVVIGYIERFTHLWSGFIGPFFLAKNISVFSSNGYPPVLIEPTFPINEFSGVTGFLRMTSTFLDPINLGHASVAWYCMTKMAENEGFLDRRKSNYYKFLFFTVIIMAFSKAAIIQFFIVSFFSAKYLSIFFKTIIAATLTLASLYLVSHTPGFLLHLNGLVNSFKSLTVFGHGLGEAGNIAQMYDSNNLLAVGDTFIGSILGQLGIVGLCYWLSPFVLISLYLKENKLILVLLWSQIALSSLSENTFNFLSIFNLAILCGINIGIFLGNDTNKLNYVRKRVL